MSGICYITVVRGEEDIVEYTEERSCIKNDNPPEVMCVEVNVSG